MILAFVLILILCSVLALPQYNHFISDGDLKFILKKNAVAGDVESSSTSAEDNGFDLGENQVYDDEFQNKIAINNAMRKNLENSTYGGGGVGSDFSPQSSSSRSLRCFKPYCSSKNQLGVSARSSTNGNSARRNHDDDDDDDDILLHLKNDDYYNDKDLYKFLEWTMEQLGSVNSYNASGSYYTGLNVWKRGSRDRPLYVEEPKYIVVRREPDDFEQKLRDEGGVDVEGDYFFIPPLSSKYFPELETLFTRDDFFKKHRGKKYKLKDILEYGEIFFPTRGKKRTLSPFEGDGGLLQADKNKIRIMSSGGYRTTKTTPSARAAPSVSSANKYYRRTFDDWLTSRCDDILAALNAAPSSPHQQKLMVTNQAAARNIVNALVSAAAACHGIILAKNSNDAIAAANGRSEDACSLAACQKENDDKINAFDQSLRMQQPHFSKGDAFNNQQQRNHRPQQRQLLRRRRRLLSSSSSSLESVEAMASAFIPHISQPDQIDRLQQYPIRNKQWRDYYIRQMATL